jgi:hypothetical protein
LQTIQLDSAAVYHGTILSSQCVRNWFEKGRDFRHLRFMLGPDDTRQLMELLTLPKPDFASVLDLFLPLLDAADASAAAVPSVSLADLERLVSAAAQPAGTPGVHELCFCAL